MLRADPRLTWILLIHVEPIYPVQYKGLSCLLSLRSMSTGVKVMDSTCRCTKWHWGHKILLSLVGITSTSVRKDFELASASLSAFLVSFESQSSSCRVIQAGILASCANMSKWKGVLSPLEGSFFKDLSNPTFASPCLVVGMMPRLGLVQLFSMSLDAMSH